MLQLLLLLVGGQCKDARTRTHTHTHTHTHTLEVTPFPRSSKVSLQAFPPPEAAAAQKKTGDCVSDVSYEPA